MAPYLLRSLAVVPPPPQLQANAKTERLDLDGPREPEARQLPMPGFHRIAGAASVARDDSPCRGLLTLRCRSCGHTRTVDFACPRVCPGCIAAVESRARSLRRALPPVPLRHWTISFPQSVRDALESNSDSIRDLLRRFVAEVFAIYRKGANGDRADDELACGAVATVHRLGSALDPNPHLHVVTLDGVYLTGDQRIEFRPHGGSVEHAEVSTIARRLGQAVSAQPWSPAARPGDGSTASRGGIERVRCEGPAAMRSPQRRSPSSPPAPAADPSSPARTSPNARVASSLGTTVYAGSPVASDDRARRARLSRYIVRPEVDVERVDVRPAGRIRYALRNAPADGTTHVDLDREVVRRRLHLVERATHPPRLSYFGILAPAAAARRRLVPQQLALLPDSPPKRRARQVQSTQEGSAGRGSRWHCPKCRGPMELAVFEPQQGTASRSGPPPDT